MSNTIQPLTSLSGVDLTIPATARGGARSGADFATATPAAALSAATPAAPYPNPSLHIDNALGLVVMEFHDDSGTVRSTIPTARQLDAYRHSYNHGSAPTTQSAAGHGGTATEATAAVSAGTGVTAAGATATGATATGPPAGGGTPGTTNATGVTASTPAPTPPPAPETAVAGRSPAETTRPSSP